MYDGLDLLILKGGRGGVLLHIHILLNCVHEYRDIYETVGLLVLKRVVVVEGLFHFHLHTYVCAYIHRHMHANIYACLHITYDFTFLEFPNFPDLQKCGNSRNREILRYWNHVCVCMYACRQTNMTLCLYQGCMNMYVCMHAYIQVCMRACMCMAMEINKKIYRETSMILYVCMKICILYMEPSDVNVVWLKFANEVRSHGPY